MEQSSLAEISADRRADRVELPAAYNLPDKQREAWLAVDTYQRENPGTTVAEAIKKTGASEANYYLAKRKLVASQGEAFGFSEDDMIRPGDKVLSDTPPLRKVRQKPGRKPKIFDMTKQSTSRTVEPEPHEPESKQPRELQVLIEVIEALESLLDSEVRKRIVYSASTFLGLNE